MTRRLTAEQVADRNIGRAAHPRTPPAGQNFLDEDIVLARPRPREEPEREPDVDVSRAIGRQPLDWEAEAITAARLGEREAGRALLAGTVQP